MQQLIGTRQRPSRKPRGGMALLLCIFVILMVSSLVLSVIDAEMLQMSSVRNVHDYERALYLANAGVHHAAAELELNSAWRGTVTDGVYPGDDTYLATAIDGTGSNVDITSIGVSGDVSRTISATVEL